jgi:hypothetical protein
MLDLIKVAEVLEAAANYIEATETKQAEAANAIRDAEVSKLASRIRDAVGENVSPEVLKLAAVNPEVTELLSRLAGGDRVDSLGGPETTKTASSSSSLPEAEAAFVNFLLS